MKTIYLILLLNLIAFFLIGYDKYLAKNNKHRISEKALLTAAMLGGSIGSGLGMLYFRHKTSKNSYLIKFWSVVIIQIIVLFFGSEFLNL